MKTFVMKIETTEHNQMLLLTGSSCVKNKKENIYMKKRKPLKTGTETFIKTRFNATWNEIEPFLLKKQW